MILANRESFAVHSRGTPTARDYVQNGLVAMWDGIENAGWGRHVDDETQMVELVTGTSIIVNVRCGSVRTTAVPVYAIEDTGLHSYTLERDIGIGIPLSVAKISGARTWTVQGVRTIHAANVTQGSRGYMLMGPTTSKNSGAVFCYPRNNAFILIYSGEWSLGNAYASTGLNTFSYSSNQSTNKRIVVSDGVVTEGRYAANMMVPSDGAYYGFGTAGFVSTLHCLRIYNRDLSVDEVALNQSIDNERFNLP